MDFLEKSSFSPGFHGFPVGFLWISYGFPIFLWFFYSFPMVFPFSRGFPMVFPWFSHGFPMDYLPKPSIRPRHPADPHSDPWSLGIPTATSGGAENRKGSTKVGLKIQAL